MPNYQYVVKTAQAQVLKGVVQADGREQAVDRLKQLDYFLLSLEEQRGASFPFQREGFWPRRVPHGEVALFTWQFASLLGAGLTILETLRTLVQQLGTSRLAPAVEQIALDVEKASSLSEALAKHPRLFSSVYVAIVRAGEEGGVLPEVMRRLAEHLKAIQILRGKITTALAYPIFLLGVGVVTILVLFAVVVPRFTTLFLSAGRGLPLPTRIMVSLGSFTQHYWWAVLLVAGVLTLLFITLLKRPGIRTQVDGWMLKMPGLRTFLIRLEMTRFARTLGELLKSGVPILTALKVTRGVARNRCIGQLVLQLHEQIEQGRSLTDGLADLDHFPALMVRMSSAGEQSGRLADMLAEVASIYDHEVERSMQVLANLVGPSLIVVLGIMVGFVVAAILLPVFQASTLIG